MALPSSPRPVRHTSGISTDQPYGPLANSGMPNPFFYHEFEDDFDNALAITGAYTVTASGGTVAHSAGDGGFALFTTGAVSSNFAEIQVPTASFTLPQVATAGKRLFYLARLQLGDVTACAVIAGICNVTTTPFTAVADGIYFSKASGGTVLNLIVTSASTAVTTAIPTAAYSLVNATNIDLGFEVTAGGDVVAFVGSGLVGFVPQSGTGSTVPTRGAAARVIAPALSTANLSPTLAIQTSATAAKTMTVDFHCVQKER